MRPAGGGFIFPESLDKHYSCSIPELIGQPITSQVTGLSQVRPQVGTVHNLLIGRADSTWGRNVTAASIRSLQMSLRSPPLQAKSAFIAVSLRSRDGPCKGFPVINTSVILTKAVDLKHPGLKYYLCLPLCSHLGSEGVGVGRGWGDNEQAKEGLNHL